MAVETDAPSSILAVMCRAAKLDATGATPAGAANMYVTDALLQFMWAPDTETGLDLFQRKGNGDLCVMGRTADVAKRYTCTLNVCTPDPEFESLIAGALLLTDTGATVGAGAPLLGQDPTPNGISLEIWSKALDGDVTPATNPFFWWAFPKIKFERFEQRTLEAGILANSYSGYMYENPAWEDGPTNDWTVNSDRAWQYQRTDSHPSSAVGLQATPAQV